MVLKKCHGLHSKDIDPELYWGENVTAVRGASTSTWLAIVVPPTAQDNK